MSGLKHNYECMAGERGYCNHRFRIKSNFKQSKKNKAAGENQFQFNFSGLNFFRAGNLRSFNRDENLLIKNIKKVGKF